MKKNVIEFIRQNLNKYENGKKLILKLIIIILILYNAEKIKKLLKVKMLIEKSNVITKKKIIGRTKTDDKCPSFKQRNLIVFDKG